MRIHKMIFKGKSKKKKHSQVPFWYNWNNVMITKTQVIVRSPSAKYRLDRYRRDKSVKFGTELP